MGFGVVEALELVTHVPALIADGRALASLLHDNLAKAAVQAELAVSQTVGGEVEKLGGALAAVLHDLDELHKANAWNALSRAHNLIKDLAVFETEAKDPSELQALLEELRDAPNLEILLTQLAPEWNRFESDLAAVGLPLPKLPVITIPPSLPAAPNSGGAAAPPVVPAQQVVSGVVSPPAPPAPNSGGAAAAEPTRAPVMPAGADLQAPLPDPTPAPATPSASSGGASGAASGGAGTAISGSTGGAGAAGTDSSSGTGAPGGSDGADQAGQSGADQGAGGTEWSSCSG